jgi:hypothetical protein
MSAACGAAAAAYYCLHNSERRRREYEEEYRRRHPIIKYRVKVDILNYGTWIIDFDTSREFKNWRKNVFNLNDNMIGFDLYKVENGIETKMDLADI